MSRYFRSAGRANDQPDISGLIVDDDGRTRRRERNLSRLDEVVRRRWNAEAGSDVGGREVVHFVVHDDPSFRRHYHGAESEIEALDLYIRFY